MVDEEPLWVFGYGSLIWRPALDVERSEPVFVEGWARRFWQGSTDHRGVPGAPGRVVTLVASAGTRCVGMAYALTPAAKSEMLERLDHREQGGYERRWLDARHHDDGRPFGRVLAYLASPENPNWLGPAPDLEIARQISRSSGPSGPNREYLTRLHEALLELGEDDPHIRGLVAALE